MNDVKSKGKLMHIDVDRILPNPSQPRKTFDSSELKELADSVVKYGIISPLTVRRAGNMFILVAGERRLRAAKLAEQKKVPCYIIDVSDSSSAVMALIENTKRVDLDFFEKAAAIQRLIEEFGYTQEQAAERLGMSQSALANKLRLLRLDDFSRLLIRQYRLTERHARALLALPDNSTVSKAAVVVAKRGYNVSETEKYIQTLLAEKTGHQKRKVLFRDVRIFLNTINRAIEVMRGSGIAACTEKNETGDSIVYTITIPK